MTKTEFQKFKKRIEEQLKISPSNVDEKNIALSNLYINLLQIWSKEMKILKQISADKDKIYGDLYHHYRFGNTPKNGQIYRVNQQIDFQLDSKSEIDVYIRSDNIYYQKALEYSDQEIIVKFIEQSLDIINSLGYRIKNYIDLQKMKKGLEI